MFATIWFWLKVAAAVAVAGLIVFLIMIKWFLFNKPYGIEISGAGVTKNGDGTILVVGGSKVKLKALIKNIFARWFHKSTVKVKYADGTTEKFKEAGISQKVTLKNIPGKTLIYMTNGCPVSDYDSKWSDPLDVIIIL